MKYSQALSDNQMLEFSEAQIPSYTAEAWKAYINIVLSERENKTVMTELEHEGPLRVQRPFYPEGGLCHVYLLHPPGGLVGSDSLTIKIQTQSGAKALFTSPGSAKFYRSAGDFAQVNMQFDVEGDSSLEWFPQENIFFPGAKAKLNTVIDLHETARFLAWDISCLGMPVKSEKFMTGVVNNRFEIKKNGQPIFLERLRVNSAQHLNAASGLRGYHMQAAFYANHCDESILEKVRECLLTMNADYPWGATLLDDLLVIRVLGQRTEKIQAMLIPVWKLLRPLILNKEAVSPRIWAT